MIAEELDYETANHRLERFIVGGFSVVETWDGKVGSILPFIRFDQYNYGKLFCAWAYSRMRHSTNAHLLRICIQEVEYLVRLAELKIQSDKLASSRLNISDLPVQHKASTFDLPIDPALQNLAS